MAKTLNGPEKAAVLVLSLSEEYAAKILGLLEDYEIKELAPGCSWIQGIQRRKHHPGQESRAETRRLQALYIIV